MRKKILFAVIAVVAGVVAAASVLTPVMVCAALLLWVIACDVAAFLFPVDVPYGVSRYIFSDAAYISRIFSSSGI